MVSLPARRAAAPGRHRGFTLAEIMVVIAIVAMLAAVAAPTLSSLIASQRVKSAAGDLFAALMRARSESVKRNVDISVTPVTASEWHQGWSMPHPTVAGSVLDSHAAIRDVTITGPAAAVIYQSNGRLRGATQPQFEVSGSDTSQKRCIEIDLSGRPYQKSSAC
jgi:type IV fimbrial biogenesis protein FimT